MGRPRRDFPWVDTEDNGTYYVYWYDASTKRTKRLSLRTRDASTAQARYAEFLAQGQDIYKPERPAELTVAQVLDAYLAEHLRGPGSRYDEVRRVQRRAAAGVGW